jgi:chemotaxis protein CheX
MLTQDLTDRSLAVEFGETEITQLVESVWNSLLGYSVQPALERSVETGTADYLTGCIPITGDWTGNVMLHCHRALTAEAASAIFGLPPEEITFELMQDALGELTNIIGGNLKALFGGKCYLGLPTVTTGHDYALRVLASGSVLRASFESHGQPFQVEICSGKTVG